MTHPLGERWSYDQPLPDGLANTVTDYDRLLAIGDRMATTIELEWPTNEDAEEWRRIRPGRRR